MKNKKFGLLSVLNLLMIAALVLTACAQANPTAAPALPTATSISLPTPTAATALPTATSITLPTATTAPALPTATSIVLPFPTTTKVPPLPTATSITLPSPTKRPSTNAATTTPSTTASGTQGQIVFAAGPTNGAQPQIFIEQADGSNLRQLVKSKYEDHNPVLSPDGRKVVFTRWTPEPTGIYVVNVDGTDLHLLNPDGCVKPCVNQEVEGHAWSPDGTQIVYARAVADASGKCCVEVGWWEMKADGSEAHLLWNLTDAAEDHFVSWSPDGQRFVFMRRDNTASPVRSAIFTMATDVSELKQVTPWELNANQPVWSPDGTLIAFQSPNEDVKGGVQNIYTIHRDGTGLTQLTKYISTGGDQGTYGPAWSPDGSQIVFSHWPSAYGPNLFVMNRDGSGLHLLAKTIPDEENPDWGPSPAP